MQINTARTGENQSNYTGRLDDDNVNFTIDFGFLQTVTGIGPTDEPDGGGKPALYLPLVAKE